MDTLLYWLARALLAALQALPLPVVAELGRAGGALFYGCDARHRRVALRNLTMCFGAEKSPAEIRALARENFRRIGENYACAVKTATMNPEEIKGCLELIGGEKVQPTHREARTRLVVIAVGHFGNFELYARTGLFVPGFQLATTYRGLRQPALNRLMQDLRA